MRCPPKSRSVAVKATSEEWCWDDRGDSRSYLPIRSGLPARRRIVGLRLSAGAGMPHAGQGRYPRAVRGGARRQTCGRTPKPRPARGGQA